MWIAKIGCLPLCKMWQVHPVPTIIMSQGPIHPFIIYLFIHEYLNRIRTSVIMYNIYNKSCYQCPSILRTPTNHRKFPIKRNIWRDELVLFQAPDKIVDIDLISKQDSPENFTLKRLDNSMQLFSLECNEETGILALHKCISADRNLHVRLYHVMV